MIEPPHPAHHSSPNFLSGYGCRSILAGMEELIGKNVHILGAPGDKTPGFTGAKRNLVVLAVAPQAIKVATAGLAGAATAATAAKPQDPHADLLLQFGA
jgi:hypothetical protein